MSSNPSRPVFIFPGQGSQYPGIGSDLHAEFASVRRIYEEASDVLGYDMAQLSFEDPEGKINLTRYTQPVLLTHHIACLTLYRELAENPLTPVAAAGHSLGEYSALVTAGTLSFADGLRLVAKRGELMSEHGEGEMMALLVDLETARPLADKHFCGIAGLNLPEQTVVGGAGAGQLVPDVVKSPKIIKPPFDWPHGFRATITVPPQAQTRRGSPGVQLQIDVPEGGLLK